MGPLSRITMSVIRSYDTAWTCGWQSKVHGIRNNSKYVYPHVYIYDDDYQNLHVHQSVVQLTLYWLVVYLKFISRNIDTIIYSVTMIEDKIKDFDSALIQEPIAIVLSRWIITSTWTWDTFMHPCFKFRYGLAKPPLNFKYSWFLTSHQKYGRLIRHLHMDQPD